MNNYAATVLVVVLGLSGCNYVNPAGEEDDFELSQDALTTRIETEGQSWSTSSGDSTTASSSTLRLNANASGDSFTFATTVASGTYAVSLRFSQRNSYGNFQAYVNGVSRGTLSGYSANTADTWTTASLGTMTLSGSVEFKFVSSGKAAAASDFDIKLDYVELTTSTSSTGTGGSSSIGVGGTTAKGGSTAKGGTTSTSGTGGNGTAGTSSPPKTTETFSGAVVTGCGTETSNLVASKVYYVTPSASSNGAGTSFSVPMSLTAALSKVTAGQMVLLQPGTYSVAYSAGAKNTLTLSKSGSSNAKIYLAAANCGKAVIDFSFPSKTWVQDSYGIYLTGSHWYLKGIAITRAGYQGAYVTGSNNTFENCAFYDNRNSGLEINKGGSYTTVINSDAYRNYDPKKNGSMADGFASKQTQGAGNAFYGCRAWENSDDGWDTFDSPQPVIIEKCWVFRNGINYFGDSSFAGNGNGFKLGGNNVAEDNRITNSVAFGHPKKGFDQNSNTGSVILYNNVSYKNAVNYGFCGTLAAGEKVVFRNNISLAGTSADSVCNSDSKNNTWNGLSVSTSDFASLDTAPATQARNTDGTLPSTNLFRLSSASKLVDKGTNVGLSYLGAAPDLGAFELK